MQTRVEAEDVPVDEPKEEPAEKTLPNEADGAEVAVPGKRQRSNGKLIEAGLVLKDVSDAQLLDVPEGGGLHRELPYNVPPDTGTPDQYWRAGR